MNGKHGKDDGKDDGKDSKHDGSMSSRGGKARAEKLSPEERSEIARTASRARWGRKQEGDPEADLAAALELVGSRMAEDPECHATVKPFVRDWVAILNVATKPAQPDAGAARSNDVRPIQKGRTQP